MHKNDNFYLAIEHANLIHGDLVSLRNDFLEYTWEVAQKYCELNAASVLGSIKTEKKSKTSAKNGLAGGRPASNVVYIYTLSDSEGVKYVGQSTNPTRRQSSHFCDAMGGRDKSRKGDWLRSKAGILGDFEEIKMEVIETCDKEKANNSENYWIRHYKKEGAFLLNDIFSISYSENGVDISQKKETISKRRITNKARAESIANITAIIASVQKNDSDAILEIIERAGCSRSAARRHLMYYRHPEIERPKNGGVRAGAGRKSKR